MIERALVGLGILLAIGAPAVAVVQQERQLAQSELVYFEIGPYDPRSLVQGDFMRVRYLVERDLEESGADEVVVRLDEQRIATFARAADGAPLAEDERLVDVFTTRRQRTVAARAYLFQEGSVDAYVGARYAIVALHPDGRAALVGLADEALQRMGPAPSRL